MSENQLRPKAGPKDVFMHLLAIGTLYASAISLIAMVFDYVNHYFPDVLNSYTNYTGLRASMAVLVVVFPVYLWLTRTLNRDLAANPEKQNLGIRKWLTNLTLFVAAIVIIGDLVTLIKNFLDGELTLRFLIKVIFVLLVAVAIFTYYRADLKRTPGPLPAGMRSLALVSMFIVAFLWGFGFSVAGSPFEARRQRLDQQRVNDLQNLQWQIVNYWQNKERLPEELAALQDPLSGFIPPADPETGASYEYRTTGTTSFELCAMFSTSNQESGVMNYGTPKPAPFMPPEYSGRGKPLADVWEHSAGRTCFSRTIDPEIYRPNRPLIK